MKSSWSLTGLWRALRWHRRAVGVVALIVCGLCAVQIARPPAPAGTPVVVTARALPPGTVLAAADLRVVNAPPALVPEGALTSVEAAVGSTLPLGQPAGAMLTTLAVGGLSSLVDPAAGEVLVPLHLADSAVVGLLRVGSLLTVVASGIDGQTTVVARHVRVAALPGATDSAGLFGTTATSPDSLVVVAAAPDQAQRLAGVYGTALGVMIE